MKVKQEELEKALEEVSPINRENNFSELESELAQLRENYESLALEKQILVTDSDSLRSENFNLQVAAY